MLRPQRHAWRGVWVYASMYAGTACEFVGMINQSVLENVSSYLS